MFIEEVWCIWSVGNWNYSNHDSIYIIPIGFGMRIKSVVWVEFYLLKIN